MLIIASSPGCGNMHKVKQEESKNYESHPSLYLSIAEERSCEDGSISDSDDGERTSINRVPTFDSTFNFQENKGKPLRPYRKDPFITIQPQPYRKISSVREDNPNTYNYQNRG